MSTSISGGGDGETHSSLETEVQNLGINENSSAEKVKILAWDYSGSTGGCEKYFLIGRKFLNQFEGEARSAEKNEEVVYLLWDSTCQVSSLKEIHEICDKRRGNLGTYPSKIINWITTMYPSNFKIELWLITDGQIDSEELALCSKLNREVNYAKIKFIMIDTGWMPGLSVGASFFSGSQLEVFSDGKLLKVLDTSKPFNYADITKDNFQEQWEELSDYIKFKFMGSDYQSLEEIDKLTELRRRLLNSVSNMEVKNRNSSLYPKFESDRQDDILKKLKDCKFYKTLTSSEVKDIMSTIDGSISTLINYIHNEKKSFGFESLKMSFKQSKMTDVIPETEPELDSLEDVKPCDFYDAVTLDDEVGTPVLLLSSTDLVSKYWQNGSYSKFRALMDCPLLANIDECIGHVYLLETFQSLCSQNGLRNYNIKNPMTNEPVFGGLIFSQAADTWNDFVFSKTFFQGKKVKTCLALWYYVIWQHAKNKDWIEASVADQLKAYALRRIHRAKVPLAFSSLPLDPKEVVPVHIALYYCTQGSSILFGENAELFAHERLRMYHSVSQVMLDLLLDLKKVQVDVEFVQNRAKVFSVISKLKRIPQMIEKRYFLLQKIFKTTPEGFLTYQLDNGNALKYLNLLDYSHKSMVPFDYSTRCSVDFSSFAVVQYENPINSEMKLSTKTCRPFFVVNDPIIGLTSYFYPLMKSLKVIDLNSNGEIISGGQKRLLDFKQNRLVSYCKLYIDLTCELNKFPSWEEYIAYARNKKRILGSESSDANAKVFLFSPSILTQLKYYYDLYSELEVTLEEFIHLSVKSISIENRIAMEGLYTGKDAKDFIRAAKSMLA